MTDTASETNLGTAITDRPDQPRNVNTARSYRSVGTHATTAEHLGPLADLPGFWQGTGFSLIARPDFDPTEPRRRSSSSSTCSASSSSSTPIGSPVPNRGSEQGDISLYGVTYLHRVTDAATGGALHIEPGVWMTIPPTSDPEAEGEPRPAVHRAARQLGLRGRLSAVRGARRAARPSRRPTRSRSRSAARRRRPAHRTRTRPTT